MRKLFLGLPIFFIAFVLGYATAHFFLPRLGELTSTVAAAPSAPIAEQPAPAPIDTTVATTSPSISDQLETIDEVNDTTEPPPKYSIKLAETGTGVITEAKNREKWFGLFETNGNYFLRETKLKVSRQEDPGEEYIGGRDIDVAGINKPLFLIKNAPKLREGKAITSFRGWDNTLARKLGNSHVEISSSPETFFETNFGKTFEIGKETFVLRVLEAKNKAGEKIWALCLYGGNQRQVLYTAKGDFAQLGILYWIGDLDHDGRPDIYCLLYGDDDSGNVLFLSSRAEKGKLVKKVAQFFLEDDC